MAGGNWQHIGFCIDVISRIAPSRVLDVGAGFGRWGILCHEFLDAEQGRRQPEKFALQVEGLESSPAAITPYHKEFYSNLRVGDIPALLGQLDGRFDLALLENQLEALPRAQAEAMLQRCLDIAEYVMVICDLGYSVGAQSLWREMDFEGGELRGKKIFTDAVGHSYGVFLLSRRDGRDLAGTLLADRLVLEEETERVARQYGQEMERMTRRHDNEMRRIVKEYQAVVDSRVWRTWAGFRQGLGGRTAAAVFRGATRLRHWKGPASGELNQGADVPPLFTAAQTEQALAALSDLPADAWVAIHDPNLAGVSASTRMFDHLLPLGEVSHEEVDEVAAAFLNRGVRRFVFSGFDPSWRDLAVSLKRAEPRARLLCLWHGSAVQMAPGLASEQVFQLVELCRRGVLDKIGFVKEGLAEAFAPAGIKTAFVMNYLRSSPGDRRPPFGDGKAHLGLFFASLDWRKNIYTQLCAASMVPGALVHLLPAHPSLQRLARQLRVPIVAVSEQCLPRAEVLLRMAAMHCNLNVTLSECCPMTVLESLALGVPCPMSATSHLFRDNEYLHSRLCVQFHDNPVEIASWIKRVLQEREKIIRAYDAYIPGYNERARQSVERFLGDD